MQSGLLVIAGRLFKRRSNKVSLNKQHTRFIRQVQGAITNSPSTLKLKMLGWQLYCHPGATVQLSP